MQSVSDPRQIGVLKRGGCSDAWRKGIQKVHREQVERQQVAKPTRVVFAEETT